MQHKPCLAQELTTRVCRFVCGFVPHRPGVLNVCDMKSVLVVDGSETIGKLFAEILQKRGWHVVACSDRDSAIKRLAGDKPFDAAVIGARVHGTTAVQFVRFIKHLEPVTMIPIALVTASDDISRRR